jgi:tight adherence protein C
MRPAAALLVALAAGLLVRRHRTAVAAGTGVALLQPLLGAAGAVALAAGRYYRRMRRRRHRAEAAAADVAVLAEMAGLGLSAGLTLIRALDAARAHVHPVLAEELDRLLRRAAGGGLGRTLAASDGYGRRFYVVAARAVVTGAPLAPAVDGFVREAVAEQRAGRLEAARRLPVRLMLPLALLILPGFVLLTVGPTVLAALERFVLPQ